MNDAKIIWKPGRNMNDIKTKNGYLLLIDKKTMIVMPYLVPQYTEADVNHTSSYKINRPRARI